MSDVRKREIICSLLLIGKDILKLFVQCLAFTILFSVCMENGWLGTEEVVTREIFWRLYGTFLAVVPLLVIFRGILGLYHVEVVGDEDSHDGAKQSRFTVLK